MLLLLLVMTLFPHSCAPVCLTDQALAPASLFGRRFIQEEFSPIEFLVGQRWAFAEGTAMAMAGQRPPALREAPVLREAPAHHPSDRATLPAKRLDETLRSEWPRDFTGTWTDYQKEVLWSAAALLRDTYPEEWEFVKTYIREVVLSEELVLKADAAVFERGGADHLASPEIAAEYLYHEAWHAYSHHHRFRGHLVPRADWPLTAIDRQRAHNLFVELECANPSLRLGAYHYQTAGGSAAFRTNLLRAWRSAKQRVDQLQTRYASGLSEQGRKRLDIINGDLNTTYAMLSGFIETGLGIIHQDFAYVPVPSLGPLGKPRRPLPSGRGWEAVFDGQDDFGGYYLIRALPNEPSSLFGEYGLVGAIRRYPYRLREFGIEIANKGLLRVPDATGLNARNARLPEDRRIPLTFYDAKGTIANRDLFKRFAEELALPWSPHDWSTHFLGWAFAKPVIVPHLHALTLAVFAAMSTELPRSSRDYWAQMQDELVELIDQLSGRAREGLLATQTPEAAAAYILAAMDTQFVTSQITRSFHDLIPALPESLQASERELFERATAALAAHPGPIRGDNPASDLAPLADHIRRLEPTLVPRSLTAAG